MSHQPYETWLFDEAELSSEQSQALQAHLQECQQCRELQKTSPRRSTVSRISSTSAPPRVRAISSATFRELPLRE